jgi:hypothetical protein
MFVCGSVPVVPVRRFMLGEKVSGVTFFWCLLSNFMSPASLISLLDYKWRLDDATVEIIVLVLYPFNDLLFLQPRQFSLYQP